MRKVLIAVVLITVVLTVKAQPGISELGQASSSIRQSFFSGRDAVLVLASIFGITGGLKIYYNWQLGRDRVTIEVAAWFFAALFMILMGPFLQVLFGI